MAWQQAITGAKVDLDLCHHMTSLEHNESTHHGLDLNDANMVDEKVVIIHWSLDKMTFWWNF